MAVVSAPLMSLGASGQLGGAIVYSSWKGRPVVRQLVTPSNPKSAKQSARRAMMRFLTQAWAALSGTNHASWDTLAKATNIAPINAYVAHDQRLWTQFSPPTAEYLHAAGTAATTAVITATGGVGQASLSIALGTLNDNWGVVVFAKLGSAPTGVFSEVILVPRGTATPVLCVITPLTPGTWHFKARPFSLYGDWGTLGADATAVVT
jgi:hypothetical protein